MACVGFDQYGSNFNKNDEEFNKWVVMCSMDHNRIFNISDFTYASKKCNYFPDISEASSRKIKIVQYRCGKKEELVTLEVPKSNTSIAVGHEQPKRVDAEKPTTSLTKCHMGLEKTQKIAPVKPPVLSPMVQRSNMESAPNNIKNRAPAEVKTNKETILGHKEQRNITSAKLVLFPPMQKSKLSSQPLEDRPTTYEKQSFTVDKKRKHVSVMDAYDSRLAATNQKLQDSYERINETKKQKAIQVFEIQKPVEQGKSKKKPDVKTSIRKKLLAMRTHNKHNKFQPLVY